MKSWILFLILIPGFTASGIARAENNGNKEGFKQALAACDAKLGLPAPTPGERPELTKDQRKALKACMADAGYKLHGHHHHRGVASSPDFRVRMAACFAQDGVPAFERGNGPPSDAQKAEFKKCRTEIKASAQ
jgi:hypothetical protein